MLPPVHFHSDRGKKAFPQGCPCCGEIRCDYSKRTEDGFPQWRFFCGAQFMLRHEGLHCEKSCPDAMRFFVERVVERPAEVVP